MWPLIIAEELVAARRALAVADIAQTLLSSDDDEINNNLRHTSVDDDEIYFYLLAKGLFYHVAKTTSKSSPSDDKIYQLVDKALLSNIYRTAAPDTDNRTAAFCIAFAQEILMDDVDWTHAIQATIDKMRESQEIPWLVQEVISLKPSMSTLKTHLKQFDYDPKSVDSMINAFAKGAYRTPKLTHYITDVGSGYLSLSESWLSVIYSVLSTGKSSLSYIFKDTREGALCLNAYLLPLWRPTTLSSLGRRPTFVSRSLSKGDIDRAEEAQMTDKGYKRSTEGKGWVLATTPTPPKDDSEKGGDKNKVLDVAQTILLNKITGNIGKIRQTKRLASVTKALETGASTTKKLK